MTESLDPRIEPIADLIVSYGWAGKPTGQAREILAAADAVDPRVAQLAAIRADVQAAISALDLDLYETVERDLIAISARLAALVGSEPQ